jgi:hypothetical protein
MSVWNDLLMEFRAGLKAARRVMEPIPADKLTWKPHEKSMTLGQLSLPSVYGPSADENLFG